MEPEPAGASPAGLQREDPALYPYGLQLVTVSPVVEPVVSEPPLQSSVSVPASPARKSELSVPISVSLPGRPNRLTPWVRPNVPVPVHAVPAVDLQALIVSFCALP